MTTNTSKLQTISEYYRGKGIFITGSTGFIGKVLLEKLLRCCPGIGNIYCLVRPRNDKDAKTRLTELCNNEAFKDLEKIDPYFSKKLHAIEGDVCDDNLGLHENDRRLLSENVQIVIHSAATLKFDEHIKTAVDMNILAVRKIVQLCKDMHKLEALVHVSTAYSNCVRDYIEEIVYTPPLDPQKLINFVSWMDNETLDELTPKILGPHPNTYTYTKQMAEYLLIKEGAGLPVAIVRPSIVTASWKEPCPGWIDNLNGPSGLYIAAGKGILHSVKVYRDYVADIIPVDLPVNVIIAAAWYTAEHTPRNRKPLVFHSTSGVLNPLTWGDMTNTIMDYFKENPLEGCFRRPKSNVLIQNSIFHNYWILVSHLIPAYIVDFVTMLSGKKPRMRRIYEKLHKAMKVLVYFTQNQWEWTHKNTDSMMDVMSNDDRKIFYTDPCLINWETYNQNYSFGMKKYILNEDTTNLESARSHIKKLRNIRYCFNLVCLILVFKICFARSVNSEALGKFVLSVVYKLLNAFKLTKRKTVC